MLVRRLNLAWKSGHPNQCLRLGDNAKTNRSLRARFRESASYGSALIVGRCSCFYSVCFCPFSRRNFARIGLAFSAQSERQQITDDEKWTSRR
jgi:hypothetical protein